METKASPKRIPKKRTLIALSLVAAIVIAVWLVLTPPGLQGKTWAVGYSVCHQIESHSLFIGDSVLPLCARCTGTFLGVLTAVSFLSSRQKRGGAPGKLKIIFLILIALGFVLDGINSSLTLLPGLNPLYPPHNLLRLASGFLFGTALANLILPLWNQTLWQEYSSEPTLRSWQQLLFLILLQTVIGALIVLDIPFLYYPVMILSTGGILVILSMVYTLIWTISVKKENTLTTWKDGIPLFLAGIITAMIQIGLMDLIRFSLTGTWQGFQL